MIPAAFTGLFERERDLGRGQRWKKESMRGWLQNRPAPLMMIMISIKMRNIEHHGIKIGCKTESKGKGRGTR